MLIEFASFKPVIKKNIFTLQAISKLSSIFIKLKYIAKFLRTPFRPEANNL